MSVVCLVYPCQLNRSMQHRREPAVEGRLRDADLRQRAPQRQGRRLDGPDDLELLGGGVRHPEDQQYAEAWGTEVTQKIAIFGALSLYLDFVNLFQFLMISWARALIDRLACNSVTELGLLGFGWRYAEHCHPVLSFVHSGTPFAKRT